MNRRYYLYQWFPTFFFCSYPIKKFPSNLTPPHQKKKNSECMFKYMIGLNLFSHVFNGHLITMLNSKMKPRSNYIAKGNKNTKE